MHSRAVVHHVTAIGTYTLQCSCRVAIPGMHVLNYEVRDSLENFHIPVLAHHRAESRMARNESIDRQLELRHRYLTAEGGLLVNTARLANFPFKIDLRGHSASSIRRSMQSDKVRLVDADQGIFFEHEIIALFYSEDRLGIHSIATSTQHIGTQLSEGVGDICKCSQCRIAKYLRYRDQ